MSDAPAFDLGKFIPGFDFLRQLATQRPDASRPTPSLGGWMAPTVSIEELDRHIQELKAVQFWLDQNVTAIKATIQALEVQKMTLATLQGMKLSMTEVVKSLTLPTGDTAATATWPYGPTPETPAPATETATAPIEPAAPLAPPTPARHATTAQTRKASPPAAKKPHASQPAATGPADPMLWWSALTQQFQQIAANALRETASVAPASAKTPQSPGKSATTKKAPGKKTQATRSPTRKSTAATPAGRGARATAKTTDWPLPPAKPRR